MYVNEPHNITFTRLIQNVGIVNKKAPATKGIFNIRVSKNIQSSLSTVFDASSVHKKDLPKSSLFQNTACQLCQLPIIAFNFGLEFFPRQGRCPFCRERPEEYMQALVQELLVCSKLSCRVGRVGHEIFCSQFLHSESAECLRFCSATESGSDVVKLSFGSSWRRHLERCSSVSTACKLCKGRWGDPGHVARNDYTLC